MNEEVDKLVAAGRIDAETGNKLAELEPGVYVLHKSWGAGRVASWDLLGDRIAIDFKDKPAHDMKLKFATTSLDVLSDDHVLSKWLADSEGLTASALEDPVSFAKLVLTSVGGSMMLDEWEAIVKGRIIPEGKYRSWWENAKKALRSNGQFMVPSKRNLPLELRAEDVSAADGLLEDFSNAPDLRTRIRALDAILKGIDEFKDVGELLQPVADEAGKMAAQALRIQPGAALELMVARDEVVEQVDGLAEGKGASVADILIEHQKDLGEFLRGIGVARQRRIYASFEKAFGDEWVERILKLIPAGTLRSIGECAKFLIERGKKDELFEFLAKGLSQRSLGTESLAWICKERGRSTGELVGPEMSPAILNALEREYLDESAPKTNKMHDLLLADKELLNDLLGTADVASARNFTRRVMMSPVFEDLNKRSLLGRMVKLHPSVVDLVSGRDSESGGRRALIVSWQSLEERKKALEKLVREEIPANSDEIRIAREYGDLRENFEFKAAKEMQAVLMRRQSVMEAQLDKAQGTDFSGADTSMVSIGTIVDIEDTATGQKDVYTILGAWDTDIDKGIISYLSDAGSALIGEAVGSEVELPSGENEVRTVRILQIRPFVTAPASAPEAAPTVDAGDSDDSAMVASSEVTTESE